MQLGELFTYIYSETIKCTDNEFVYGNHTVNAEAVKDHHQIVLSEQNMFTCTVLEINGLDDIENIKPDTIISFTPRIKGLIATNEVLFMPANTEFDNLQELIPRRMEPMYSMAQLNELQNLYVNKLIVPTYDDRLWGLYSFGDRYMQQDFMRMRQIKKKIWEVPVYIRFLDDFSRKTTIDKCTMVSFDMYPNRNCLLMRHVDSIEIENGICHLRVIHKGITPIDVYLYEETTMILKG